MICLPDLNVDEVNGRELLLNFHVVFPDLLVVLLTTRIKSDTGAIEQKLQKHCSETNTLSYSLLCSREVLKN